MANDLWTEFDFFSDGGWNARIEIADQVVIEAENDYRWALSYDLPPDTIEARRQAVDDAKRAVEDLHEQRRTIEG